LNPFYYRIGIKGTEFGGTFYYNRTDHVFFQSLGKKNEKLGVSGHGIFFRLWAVRARSARRRSLTTPWAMPPTAGAMKTDWGWMYYPTIYHGDFLLNNCHLGRRQPWPPPPPMGRPQPFRSMTRVDNTMGDTPYHRRY